MTLADLNAMTPETFESALGWVFEDSPWVAQEAASLRPFHDLDALHAAMVNIVACAPHHRQLVLLRAHPDLGSRAAAIAPASQREQTSAGLNQLEATTHTRLLDLNALYQAKFRHPFLFAVKGSTPAVILAALDRRLESTPEAEFAEALEQVYRIARFRLQDTLQE